MKKYDIRQDLDTRRNLTRTMESQIRSKATLHGSRVTGGATEDSDWDWIAPPGMEPHFEDLVGEGYGLYNAGDYPHDEYRSIYVKSSSGEIWNILYMNDMPVYRTWIRASKAAALLSEIDPFIRRALASKKENRALLVEALRNLKV